MPNSLASINTDSPVPSSTETVTSSAGKFILYRLSSEFHGHYCFSGSWGRELSHLGQIHASQPPAISCVSRPHLYRLSPYYDTSRVPNHYRLQSFRPSKPPNGTVPFDSSNSRDSVRLLLSYHGTSYQFLPQAVPSPGCLSFPSIATTSLRDTLSSRILYVFTRICFVRVPPRICVPRPFSLNHSYRHVSSGRERGRSSDTQRVQGEFIGNTTGLRHLLLDCSKSAATPHHSYGLATTIRGEEGVVGKLEKYDINSNMRAPAPPSTLKDNFEPRTSVRFRTRTLSICS